MQLTYVNTVKSLICAQLEDGETIPKDVKKPDKPALEGPGTFFISVDGSREDYLALIKMDPTLESVVDPAAQPEDKVILAAQGCPTQAITVSRDGEKLV